MRIICLDLEGVLIPEMWIRVADKTNIEDLRLTTRDVDDYDKLMRHRIEVLEKHNLTLTDIRRITSDVEPLEGAREFLDILRSEFQVAILSDTFVEFAMPAIARLGMPLILCNELVIDQSSRIVDYRLRQQEGKRQAVRSFRTMNLQVTAVGDSFNDITMIREANCGVLFRPSEAVRMANPDLPVTNDHVELLEVLRTGRRNSNTVV